MVIKESYRQSLVITFGTVFNSVLGLVFYVLVARMLGVAQFGRFSYYLGIGVLIAEVTDFGLGSAIVKFGQKETFLPMLALAGSFRIGVFIFLITCFAFLAAFDPFLIYPIFIALSLHLSGLVSQGLIARQKFRSQVVANICGNLGRLVITWWLLTFALLTTISGLVIFCLGAATTFFIGLFLLRKELISQSLNLLTIKNLFSTVWRYSTPLAASFSLSSFSSRIDIPILYALTSPISVGLYSSAQKLTSVVTQVSASLDSVFSPKFSQKNLTAFKDYFLLVIILCFGLVPAALFAPFVSSWLLPRQYHETGQLLTIFLLSYIPLFLAGPFAGKILYQFGKSKYYFFVSIVSLAVSLTGYFLLVPALGALGAVLTFSLTNSVSLILYVCLFSFLSRH